jgi:hypothetical protein
VWILAARGEATPTQGRAIDHIGWRSPTSLNDTMAELQAKGVTVTSAPRPLKLPNGPPRPQARAVGSFTSASITVNAISPGFISSGSAPAKELAKPVKHIRSETGQSANPL